MNILTFNTYGEATRELKREIADRQPNLKHPKLIIVPEIYTFAFERIFYSMGKGSFDVRVCSLSKLYADYCDGNAVSRAGAIALVRRILFESRGELTYYSSSFDKRGFSSKLYELIEKLASSGVAPEQLKSSVSAENMRLGDIKLVYTKYLAATAGEKVDSVGKIYALKSYIEQNPDEFCNFDVYFANFDVFNRAQNELIETLDGVVNGLSVYLSKTVDGYAVPQNTTVFQAQSLAGEMKEVVRTIRNAIIGGARYGEFAVLGENINYELLKRIFDENDVPFYYDNRVSLFAHEVGRFILSAIACVTTGGRREQTFALIRNSLVLSPLERDAFIGYANMRMLNFSSFFQPVEPIPDFADCELAEKARVRLTAITDCFKGVNTPIGLLTAVRRAFELTLPTADETADRMKELALNCLSVLGEMSGENEFTLSELENTLEEMFISVSLPVIPNQSDCVFVGAVNSRRGLPVKHLFIVGFNDGVLPKQTDAPDLIGDLLLDELCENGVKIEPRSEQMNERFRDEVLQVLSSARNLHISYVSDGNNKKSYLLTLIEKVNGLCEYSESDGSVIITESTNPDEIARCVPTESLCLEKALILGKHGVCGSLTEAVKDRAERLTAAVTPLQEQYLTGGTELNSVSVSRIKTYFDCPRSYYFRYILGVKEQRFGEVDVLDVGNILHEVVEKFVARRGEMELSALTEMILAEVLNKYPKTQIPENRRMVTLIRGDAQELCRVADAQIEKGSFTPKLLENDFSSVISLDENGGEVSVIGKIDRVDIFDDYARIIDYKTGKHVGLTASEVYYGTKLQLPVYAGVVKEQGYKIAGMFYFPVSVRLSMRLSGVCLDDDAVITAMDNDALNGDEPSEVFNFSNPFVKSRGERVKKGELMDDAQIDAVISYAHKCVGQAANEIKSGFIARSPRAGGNGSVCDYCAYKSLCDPDQNVRSMPAVTWETIEEAGND